MSTLNLAKSTKNLLTPVNQTTKAKPPKSFVFSEKSLHLSLGFLIPLLVLILWHVTTTTGLVPAYHLPTPVAVWNAAVDLFDRGQLLPHVTISTQRTLIGFAIGSGIGLVFGAISGLSKFGASLLAPTFAALRAVPSLAWVPMLILWLRIGEESRITLVAIGAFFPVYTTLVAALRNVDAQLIEMGRQFGLKGISLLATIQLPAVLPNLLAGLRLALAQAWLFLVAAELIASSSGLGWLLTDSQQTGRIDRIILSIVLLAALGAVTNAVLALVEKVLFKKWAF